MCQVKLNLSVAVNLYNWLRKGSEELLFLQLLQIGRTE